MTREHKAAKSDTHSENINRRLSGDDGDDETVHVDIQEDHSAYNHWLQVAELVSIHDETP